MTLPPHAGAFLEECAQFSGATYRVFEALLSALSDARERGTALRLLHDVANLLEKSAAAARNPAASVAQKSRSLSLERVQLPPLDGERHELRLLQLPSVFAPESWSFTFFEGLTRLPRSYFQDQVVAELGSGNGWISIALARYAGAKKLFGLDINPRAILSAKLNLYLNTTDPDGSLHTDAEGVAFLERVEFHTSDLMAHCLAKKQQLDRIIGCIPQVLDPDLEGTAGIIADTASDEFLYALSNYCGKQGYVEDQFGLGLMARVLEEGIELLRPNGSVVFNLGGRPGRAVLHRLFERRGFRVREIWQRRAAQAADTDISTLVAIEERTPHRFEFFMGRHSDAPISAKTAEAYALKATATEAAITHAISVYEGRLAYPNYVRSIFTLLGREPYHVVKGAIDLAFSDDTLAEEKLGFLSALASSLSTGEPLPYGETSGDTNFRQGLADYFETYFGVHAAPSAFVVAPTQAALVRNLLSTYRPRLLLVDRDLARYVPEEDVKTYPTKLLEGPRRADLSSELILHLCPDLVLTALAEFETRTTDAFTHLLETTARVGARLVVDLSEHFELSSTPASNGVLTYLAEHELPPHVSVLVGFVRGRVYQDLELAWLYSGDAEQTRALTLAAELSYSRVPLLTQRYYARILSDLLDFRIERPRRPSERAARLSAPPASGVKSPPPIAPAARAAFDDPVLLSHTLPLSAETLRMDYGENALAYPSSLGVKLLEAFARQNLSATETDPTPEVRALLSDRFGVPATSQGAVAFGGGVAPLFASLARTVTRASGTLVVPSGNYGYFNAAARLVDTRIVTLPTDRAHDFKVTASTLERALEATEDPWFFLNGPIVNPTGALYSDAEIQALLDIAAGYGCPVILDTIFSGLEFPGVKPGWDLRGLLERSEKPLELALLGGISKELAAGGLRFGYGWSNSERLRRALETAERESRVHGTLRFAAKQCLAELLSSSIGLSDELLQTRRTLEQRALELCRVLERTGWEPLRPEGGLFLVARPSFYLDKELTLDVGGKAGASPEKRRFAFREGNIAEALFFATGLLINDPAWTGIPEHCRLVYAIEEATFERALVALEKFRGLF